MENNATNNVLANLLLDVSVSLRPALNKLEEIRDAHIQYSPEWNAVNDLVTKFLFVKCDISEASWKYTGMKAR